MPSGSTAAVLLGCLLACSTANSTSGADAPAVAFELQGNAYRVGAVVFSRDLQWLAADVGQISISPEGGCVAGVVHSGEFAFWSLPEGRRLTHLPTKRAPWEMHGNPFTFNSMPLRMPPASMSPDIDWAFSPDGRVFAIGHRNTKPDSSSGSQRLRGAKQTRGGAKLLQRHGASRRRLLKSTSVLDI